MRSPASIHATRMVEINKSRVHAEELLQGGVEKRRLWLQADRCSMHVGWTNNTRNGKSRYVVKDFANTRDPTMFAAASDTAVGRRRCFKTTACSRSMSRRRTRMLGRTNSLFWNRHRRRSRSTEVIVCGDNIDMSDLWASQGCKIVAGAF